MRGALESVRVACVAQTVAVHVLLIRIRQPGAVVERVEHAVAVDVVVVKALDGLATGVGHVQQCALGAITRESFLKTGTYAAVQKNVVVQAPSGDLLIVQLRGGALDAVVAYQSNVTPYASDLDAMPVTGIPCAAPQQPIAIRKDCRYPQLAQRFSGRADHHR